MKAILSDAGIAAIRLLEALDAASDAFPPLKSAAGGALHIAKLVQNFRSNKTEWASFAEHVQKSVAIVAQAFSDQQASPAAMYFRDGLEKLNIALGEIQKEVKDVQDLKFLKRVKNFMRDPDRIKEMEKKLDKAMVLFQLNVNIQVSQDVTKIVQGVSNIIQSVQDNVMALQNIQEVQGRFGLHVQEDRDHCSKHNTSLAELPYAQGATWDPMLVCQPGTRKFILEEIMEWIGNFQTGKLTNYFS
ncbi:hypothetical protein SCHPADRAFT_906062 [Schizopora paradoxa]|uniref:Fungal N-terminal domain-containing protein n=1 Tax=Schizopora paradoxa TaxID=27342 RepID=A0A0H2RHV0_9AGAM|nr:hypothetical protein SCHPADRAFT_906062 [Schizopora paradoxa]